MRLAPLLIAVTLTTLTGSAEAQDRFRNPANFESTVNRHFGFYFRPDLGFGYMSASETANNGATLTISGASGLGGLAVGGAVTENSILAVHIIDAVTSNPTVSLSTGTSGPTSNTQMVLWGIGPEYTYYLMPANVYVSATLALTRLTLTVNGDSGNSNWGVGSRLAVGKEWWVSDHWGLGLAGHFSFSSNEDPNTSTGASYTLKTWALGAVFSATYN